LQGRSEIGDGDVYRAVADVQHRHHDPPQLDNLPGQSLEPDANEGGDNGGG
jgi:hypothetical protein